MTEDGGISRGLRLSNGLRRFTCGCAECDSFAFLATRDNADGTAELGARGYGPKASGLADRLTAQIREWDLYGRDLPGDAFAYWPTGTRHDGRPGKVAAFPKALGTATIRWPASGDTVHEDN
jgi:protein-L-isoaspartate(D-aspartate) O-methyltransferase